MPQEVDHPCPTAAPLLVCACGAVLLTCPMPTCAAMHAVRTVEACGVCTATGGQPVPACPLCAVLGRRTPQPMTVWMARLAPFLDTPCRCATTVHGPALEHPHRPTGCTGFAWQGEEDA
jgi:hypothetical protein